MKDRTNKEGLADFLGISTFRVEKLTSKRVFQKGPDRLYDVRDNTRRYLKFLRSQVAKFAGTCGLLKRFRPGFSPLPEDEAEKKIWRQIEWQATEKK